VTALNPLLLIAPATAGALIILAGLAEHPDLRRIVLGLVLIASTPLLLLLGSRGARVEH
jgi:hypothetical protein